MDLFSSEQFDENDPDTIASMGGGILNRKIDDFASYMNKVLEAKDEKVRQLVEENEKLRNTKIAWKARAMSFKRDVEALQKKLDEAMKSSSRLQAPKATSKPLLNGGGDVIPPTTPVLSPAIPSSSSTASNESGGANKRPYRSRSPDVHKRARPQSLEPADPRSPVKSPSNEPSASASNVSPAKPAKVRPGPLSIIKKLEQVQPKEEPSISQQDRSPLQDQINVPKEQKYLNQCHRCHIDEATKSKLCSICDAWTHTYCYKAKEDSLMEKCPFCVFLDKRMPVEEHQLNGKPAALKCQSDAYQYFYNFKMYSGRMLKIGDTVYVDRDRTGLTQSGPRECDIFRITHLLKTEQGQKCFFGIQYFRAAETTYKPSKRFYYHELFETICKQTIMPISLIRGFCAILTQKEYLKGKPKYASKADTYICDSHFQYTLKKKYRGQHAQNTIDPDDDPYPTFNKVGSSKYVAAKYKTKFPTRVEDQYAFGTWPEPLEQPFFRKYYVDDVTRELIVDPDAKPHPKQCSKADDTDALSEDE